jgi:long-chain acyl-CoA synthetase
MTIVEPHPSGAWRDTRLPALGIGGPLSERETVPAVILAQAERLGDRDYLRYWRDGRWCSLSWNAFALSARRVAGALVARGLQPGDRVAVLSENRFEWLVCDLGIQLCGCVTVPIYPTLAPRVVREIVEDSGSRLVIVSGPELLSKLDGAAPEVQVAAIDVDVDRWMEQETEPSLAAEVDRRLAALAAGDLATVVYTSGTTGRPKGVMLTHRSLVMTARAALEVFAIGETDTVLSFLPYSHVLERVDGVFIPSSAGATLWLARSMDTLAEDIQEARPTVMLGVPRVFEKIYEAVHQRVAQGSRPTRFLFRAALAAGSGPGRLLAEPLVLKSLRSRLTGGRLRFFISGGAPLNEKVEDFFWRLGIKILQGWGLTESTSGVTSNTETAHRYRTVGRPLPGIELRMEPDGEILVRGAAVMAGYLNQPAATAETVVDGWLRTGDIGVQDADGFLTITDRKKDLIKTAGGKYIAPMPIEARLMSDHYVKSALVVGDDHPYAVALLVPDWKLLAAEGITGEPAALVEDPRVRELFQRIVDATNEELASFETVKRFALLPRDFSESFDELTPTLKPKRRIITAHFAEQIAKLYPTRELEVAADRT